MINITVEQLRSVPDSNKLILQRFIRHETIGLLKFIKDIERIVYKLRQKSIDNIHFPIMKNSFKTDTNKDSF